MTKREHYRAAINALYRAAQHMCEAEGTAHLDALNALICALEAEELTLEGGDQ